MSTIIADIESIQDQFRQYREELETTRLQLQSSERTRKQQKEQITELVKENQTLNGIILNHHHSIQTEIELTRDLHNMKSEHTRLEMEMMEAKKQFEDEKAEMQRETEHLQRHLHTQQQQIEDLQKQNKEKESAFQCDLSHLEKSYESARQQMQTALEKIEAEKQSMEAALKKEIQERALASYTRSGHNDSTDVLKARLQRMKAELIKVQKERDALKRH